MLTLNADIEVISFNETVSYNNKDSPLLSKYFHGLLNISINCLDKMLHCLNYNVACCIDFWNFNFSILCATTLEKLTQELQNLLRNSTHELTHKI